MERIQTVKNSILTSKNIKIFFEKDPSTDCLSAVLALFSILKKMDKKVFLPIENFSERTISFLSTGKKKISISLNEEISEIYYDKNEDGIKLNIIPKNDKVKPEDFSWETDYVKKDFASDSLESFDLVISIGLPRFEQLDRLLQAGEDELFECTIVNIDNDIDNENYGDINIVEQKNSIPKIISILIKQLGEEYFNSDTMSFLLGGFLSQERIKSEDIAIVKWLVKNNANFDFYYANEDDVKPEWLNQFKDCLLNMNLSDNKEIAFSRVDDERIPTRDILDIVKVFHEWLASSSFFFSFIDNNDSTTKTIFYSSDKEIIEKIEKYYSGTFKKTGGIIISNKYPKEINEQLKKIL